MREFRYDDIATATDSFSPDRLIGKGSHGCVYKGVLKGGSLVAVKTPSLSLKLLNDTSNLANEIAILSSLPPATPNTITPLGFAIDPQTQQNLLVMDFMPNGSLHDLLHQRDPPTWRLRAAFAGEIAASVAAIHAAGVVHRDVKSANVLFDRKWRARLADFSLAVRMRSTAEIAPAGTMGYIDPGYTAPARLAPANDVFSFGVLLLELASGRRAVEVANAPAAAAKEAPAAARRMVGVAMRCVCTEAEGRPGMMEVAAELGLAAEEVGCRVWRRVYRVWRRRTTRRIVIVDHLIDGDEDGGGEIV